MFGATGSARRSPSIYSMVWGQNLAEHRLNTDPKNTGQTSCKYLFIFSMSVPKPQSAHEWALELVSGVDFVPGAPRHRKSTKNQRHIYLFVSVGDPHSGNGLNPHPARNGRTASTDTIHGAELLALHTSHRPLDGHSHPMGWLLPAPSVQLAVAPPPPL